MPGPGVPNGDPERRLGRAARLDRDLALAGELERVAEQVDEDLADPLAVEDDLGRRAGVLPGEADPLLRGQRPVLGDDRLDELARIERLRVDRQPARLDLRQVEDLVDQAEQVATAALDPAERCPSAPRSAARRRPPRSASVNPRIAFIGVRSSWLTLARKRDLASLARASEAFVSSSRLVRARCSSNERGQPLARLVEVVGELPELVAVRHLDALARESPAVIAGQRALHLAERA